MIRGCGAGMISPSRCRHLLIWAAALLTLLSAPPGGHADDRQPAAREATGAASQGGGPVVQANQPAGSEPDGSETRFLGFDRIAASRSLQTVALFALISLAPVGLLMLTGFVRISIVLTLLRQALGSPQVPGNQVITALSLLLTALVMWPCGEKVYREAISPYAEGQISLRSAWDVGSRPIKAFMVEPDRADQARGLPGGPERVRGAEQPRGGRIRPRHAPRISRSGSWRRPSCSAS